MGSVSVINAQEKQPAPDRATVEHTSLYGAPQDRRRPMPPPGDFVFISPEMGFNGKLVKGAPYSAQAVTRVRRHSATATELSVSQPLRSIVTVKAAHVASKALRRLARWPQMVRTIFISDPVAGVDYFLDVRNQTARKMAPMKFNYQFKTPLPEGEKQELFEKKIEHSN